MNSYFDLEGQLHIRESDHSMSSPQIVWVPSRWVSILQVFVPGKSRAQWQAALPYALEEQLAQSLDDVHLVALNRDKQGRVTVAVVEKQRMQAWVDALQQYKLNQAWLIPECFSLGLNAASNPDPASEQQVWHIQDSQIESDTQLVRTGQYQGFSLAKAQWPEFLQRAQQLHESIDIVPVDQDLVIKPSGLRALNLRQGEFTAVSNAKGPWRAWQWPAGLVALWMVFLGVQTHLQTQQTLQQAQAYQQQTETLFRQLFPQTQRIVNIQVQTQAFLNQTEQQGAGLAPVQVLALLAPHLAKQTAIMLGRMDWQRDGLSLRLSASTTDQLEQLLTSVRADLPAGAQARLQIQTVANNKVEGTLHVQAN